MLPSCTGLFRITNEKRWYERTKAIWQNGCQHISDGTLIIKGLTRPVGSQDEFFETTRQSLDGRKNSKPGTSSGWLVACSCAFRLDVIHKLKDMPEVDDFFEMSDRY